MVTISYSVPHIGPVDIPLYSPADEVYSLLNSAGEIARLEHLNHIGALSYVFPGISHTRWDYTVSMLYVVTRLRKLVTSSEFSLGEATFSSMAAALQCLALLSNIGHLPGTYCVEKGVARFLLGRSRASPSNCLFEDTLGADLSKIDQVVDGANGYLRENDYLALNRLCAIVKLATNFRGKVQVPEWLTKDFFTPFIIRSLRSDDPRWSELDEFFDASRRLAYLNRDSTLIHSPVTVGLSPLISNLVDPKGLTKEALLQSREITSAYEHILYEKFYYAPQARKAIAVVATSVLDFLRGQADAESKIADWMYDHVMDNVIDPQVIRHTIVDAIRVGAVSLRTFFCSLSGTESEIESRLEQLLRLSQQHDAQPAVAVCKYVPSDSPYVFEPDQFHLDALVLKNAQASHVGRLLKWIADDLEDRHDDPADFYAWYVKPEVGRIHENLFSQLIEIAWPEFHAKIRSWPLSRLGKFKMRDGERDDIPIWHASSDLNDKFTKHIVRDISDVPPALTSIRDELRGLAQLRTQLRRPWRNNRARPRKSHFLITASIRLSKDTTGEPMEREFDGGILQISSRTGSARLYLLETKGAQTPIAAENALKKKLEALKIGGSVARLRSRSAYATLAL